MYYIIIYLNDEESPLFLSEDFEITNLSILSLSKSSIDDIDEILEDFVKKLSEYNLEKFKNLIKDVYNKDIYKIDIRLVDNLHNIYKQYISEVISDKEILIFREITEIEEGE